MGRFGPASQVRLPSVVTSTHLWEIAMFHSPANQRDHLSSLLSRRDAVRIGGAGLLGLGMGHFLQGAALRADDTARRVARAKSVIFLYQFGGPSHVDTFDLKLDAPSGLRTQFGSISSAIPGIPVCEHLPETAKVLDKVTLIRSVHHTMNNHNSAAYHALTGHAPALDDIRLRDSLELFPSYGSVADRFLPPSQGLPAFVALPHVMSDGAVTPGQHASFLGKNHDPLLITEDPNDENFRLPELSLPAGVSPGRLQRRREMQLLVNSQLKSLESQPVARGLNDYFDRALSMLSSPKVREAFDLSKEPVELRDRYGRTTYGQSCLLARRLVESGVKFVNVYFSSSIGGQDTSRGGWDTHGFNNTRMYPILKQWQLPLTDRTLPTLINDLDERGLLDETLVLWMGEFGRTPRLNDNISRDHWPRCYTVLAAGGGMPRGHVYGASDKQGAYPAKDPVTLGDLSATMFELLGIPSDTEMRDTLNRPFPIADGRPIAELMG
jgi:Protein of unknown function (DUF1501)